jgi:hypothetical protein
VKKTFLSFFVWEEKEKHPLAYCLCTKPEWVLYWKPTTSLGSALSWPAQRTSTAPFPRPSLWTQCLATRLPPPPLVPPSSPSGISPEVGGNGIHRF